MSKTKFVILGLLTEKPLSGYEIKKTISIRFHFFWNESFGQIYPALKKMEHENWIEVVKNPDDASRNKKYYKITKTGYEEFRKWLKDPSEKDSVRNEMLLKLYFSSHISSDIMIEHIKLFYQNHQKDLQILKLFQEELSRIPDPENNHKDIIQVIKYGVATNQAYLKWCMDTIDYLKEREHEK